MIEQFIFEMRTLDFKIASENQFDAPINQNIIFKIEKKDGKEKIDRMYKKYKKTIPIFVQNKGETIIVNVLEDESLSWFFLYIFHKSEFFLINRTEEISYNIDGSAIDIIHRLEFIFPNKKEKHHFMAYKRGRKIIEDLIDYICGFSINCDMGHYTKMVIKISDIILEKFIEKISKENIYNTKNKLKFNDCN